MNNAPPPAEVQPDTPKKPWSKPTISIIGETVDEVGSGQQSDPYLENVTYGPSSS